MTMIHLGTITMGIVLLAIIWMSLNSIIRAIKLMKLRKQVLNGADLGSGKDWRKGALLYHVNNFFRRCVYVIAIILLFALFGDYISYEKYIPLEEYTGDMPFKTMQDFGPGGEMHLMNMKINNLNTVREWSDLLSPVNFEWDESGTVTYADGTKLSGGLEVIYHETKADWIAKRLAKEYLRKAKSEKDYEPLELEMENLDDVAAYDSILHFPSVILRKDNKIIHARFYRTGLDSVEYELVEWAGFLSESL